MTTVAGTAVPLARAARDGALAGVAGGLVFGAAMIQLGVLPTVAAIARMSSPVAGFVIHMLIAALVGAGFGLLVAGQRTRAGELLFWGLCYGALWWLLGALTLHPILLGRPVMWDLTAAQAVLPSLVGHLAYGATIAIALAAIRRDRTAGRRAPVVLVRGGVAGLLAITVVSAVVPGWHLAAVLATPAWRPVGMLVLGAVLGVGYVALFTGRAEGSGPALIRGVGYGFVCWLVAGLTLPPLLSDGSLDWSPRAARAATASLPGYLLTGAGIAVLTTWSGALLRALFGDDIRRRAQDSARTRSARAIAHGMLAGLAGGLVFTLIMLPVGLLPTVARLVGADSPITGLIVHLLIAQAIGITYTALFHRHSPDSAAAIGWGASYGFLWWILGPLTLMPLLLGATPPWTADGLVAAFPSLIGHLGYGVAVGVVSHRLERRASPWWLPRSEWQARRLREHREQLLGSAPALWALTTLIATLLPLILGM